MSDYDIDTSREEFGAKAVFVAAVLFAKVSGMNAENEQRKAQGYSMAYTYDAYDECVNEAVAAMPRKAR